jgi:hypothetical protein
MGSKSGGAELGKSTNLSFTVCSTVNVHIYILISLQLENIRINLLQELIFFLEVFTRT